MILLDTNVISELWRPEPDSSVLTWVDAQAIETLALSAITVAELRFGIEAMPEGRRREIYLTRLDALIRDEFKGRVLPFDLDASIAYGSLMAKARLAGVSIGTSDGYIAATALAHGLSVATRDTTPFAAASVDVINPWKTQH